MRARPDVPRRRPVFSWPSALLPGLLLVSALVAGGAQATGDATGAGPAGDGGPVMQMTVVPRR
jgi:hypothetical protein